MKMRIIYNYYTVQYNSILFSSYIILCIYNVIYYYKSIFEFCNLWLKIVPTIGSFNQCGHLFISNYYL